MGIIELIALFIILSFSYAIISVIVENVVVLKSIKVNESKTFVDNKNNLAKESKTKTTKTTKTKKEI